MFTLLMCLVFLSWMTLHAPILVLTNSIVPRPYMDEPFHYQQAVEIYQNPRHPSWDEKITTPPGLYYVTLVMTGWREPRIEWMRLTSALFNSLSLCVVMMILLANNRNNNKPKTSGMLSAWLSALKIMTFPPLFFVGQLYYTDAGGLFFLLAAWFFRDQQSMVRSILCSAIAIWFRQTNAVWVLFIGGFGVVQQFQRYLRDPYNPREYVDVFLGRNGFSVVEVVKRFGGYFLIPVGYILSVLALNGGHMVHGDKDNHQLSQHWSQLCYFAVVLMASSGLGIELVLTPKRTLQLVVSHIGLLIGCVALVTGFVQRFFITHPFLLADNRHFSFYIWSKFFRVHESAKYVPIPLYATGLFFASIELFTALPPLAAIGFMIACVLSLVPLPLFEPRYFIVPFVFYALLTVRSKPKRLADTSAMLTILIHLAVNAAVAWLFWFRPFVWADGSIARFMW